MAVQKKSEARKEQILKAAGRVFAQKGFHDSTISAVAKEAGVSDATIYEYFSTKEELLFSIPLEATRRGKETIEFHMEFVRGAANKLRSLIYGYLWFYQSNPDYSSVALLILKQNRKFMDTEAYRLVREWSRMIIKVVEEGVESGEFKPDTDPYLVRSIILGTIEHMVISSILVGRPEKFLEHVDPLTDTVIGGIQKDGQEGWNVNIVMEKKGTGD